MNKEKQILLQKTIEFTLEGSCDSLDVDLNFRGLQDQTQILAIKNKLPFKKNPYLSEIEKMYDSKELNEYLLNFREEIIRKAQ